MAIPSAGSRNKHIGDRTSGNYGAVMVGDDEKVTFGDDMDMYLKWNGTLFALQPLTDDVVIKVGDGTASADLQLYGNIPTAYLEWDASLNALSAYGPARIRHFNKLSDRFELKWVAGQRGKPGINADIQNAAEATRMIADPDFELLGTNAVSTCSAYATGGGITYTTTTGSGDQVIQVPHLDTSQSAWGTVLWPTSKQVVYTAHFVTASNITNAGWFCGLKLTNTPVVATDNDQVFFRYEDSVNSGKIQAVSSIANVDDATDTTTVTETVSTEHRVAIIIDSSRIARMYLDGVLVKTTAALTSTNLIPYFGVFNNTTAAKAITILGCSISRAY